jgi:hypothetical protein
LPSWLTSWPCPGCLEYSLTGRGIQSIQGGLESTKRLETICYQRDPGRDKYTPPSSVRKASGCSCPFVSLLHSLPCTGRLDVDGVGAQPQGGTPGPRCIGRVGALPLRMKPLMMAPYHHWHPSEIFISRLPKLKAVLNGTSKVLFRYLGFVCRAHGRE